MGENEEEKMELNEMIFLGACSLLGASCHVDGGDPSGYVKPEGDEIEKAVEDAQRVWKAVVAAKV